MTAAMRLGVRFPLGFVRSVLDRQWPPECPVTQLGYCNDPKRPGLKYSREESPANDDFGEAVKDFPSQLPAILFRI